MTETIEVTPGNRAELMRVAKDMFLSGRYGSLSDIARTLGIKRAETLRGWCKKGGWEAERQGLTDRALSHVAEDVPAIEKLKEIVAQTVDETLNRHIEHGVTLQHKAMNVIKGMHIKSLPDAMRLLEYGVTLERIARQLAPVAGSGRGGGSSDEVDLSADKILAAFVKVANNKRIAEEAEEKRVPVSAEVVGESSPAN